MGGFEERGRKNNMNLSLSHITLITTQKCNLSCKTCYINNNVKDELNIVNLEKSILAPFTNLGGKSVGFSGGEPLMYEWLFDAIRLAKQYNLFVSVVTNGVLLSFDIAKTLAQLGVNSLQISLDSSDESYNDAIRGKGNKEMVVTAINNAVRAGLTPSLVAVPNISLLRGFETYINEAQQLKVRSIYLRRPIRKVNPVVIQEEMTFNRDFLRKVQEMRFKWPNIIIASGDPLFNVLERDNNREKGSLIPMFSGCSAGVNSLAIWPNGIVTPCTKLFTPIGNVYHEALGKMWLESELLGKLRQREFHGKCGQCSFRYLCGGCRASAFVNTLDVYGSDPLCHLNND